MMGRNLSDEEIKQIVTEIYKMLGGINKLRAMLGATHVTYGVNKLNGNVYTCFRFKMYKHYNLITIELNAMDLYDITFERMTITKDYEVEFKSKKVVEGLYGDMLKPVIEEEIQLRLSL